jgi:hypothetical protein
MESDKVKGVTPDYGPAVNKFLASIPMVKWFANFKPRPRWRVFIDRLAASAAAGHEVGDTSRDAAWNEVSLETDDAIEAADRDEAADAAEAAAKDIAWEAARDATMAAAGIAPWDLAPVETWCAGDTTEDRLSDADIGVLTKTVMGVAEDLKRDVALMARILICDGLQLDEQYVAHAKCRWDVWQQGYGLFCDVMGVLFVYKQP